MKMINRRAYRILTACLFVFAFCGEASASDDANSEMKPNLEVSAKNVKPSDSFAANAVSGFGIEVNPQTGQPGVNIECINLPGIADEMDLSLGLSAHDLAQGDRSTIYGFPPGWKWDLDYVDTKNDVLNLTGSASLALDSSWPSGLRYVKSGMFRMERLPGELTYDKRAYSYRLTMLDGSSRYFDKYGRLICIDDRFGNRILYYFEKDTFIEDSRLVRINDSYGQDIRISYTGDKVVKEAVITMPDERKASCSFNITPSLSSNVTIVSPEGRTVVIRLSENGRIREVAYPSGGSIRYEYNDNAIDYILARGDNRKSFPAVSRVIEDSGHAGSAKKTTSYDYRAGIGRFYTGYPNYPFGSNTLFTSGDNSFSFSTLVTSRRKPENGGDQMTCITFNNLSLPVRTEIRQGGSLKQTTTPKFAGQDAQGLFPSLSQLDGNYSRTRETLVQTGSRKINNETLTYNPEGLVSSSTERTGPATAEITTSYFSRYGLEDTSRVADSAEKDSDISSENTLDASGKYIAGTVTQRGGEKVIVNTAMDIYGRITQVKTNKQAGAEPSTITEKSTYTHPLLGGHELTTTTWDGLGHETSVSVDLRNGFVMKETDAMGRSTTYKYENNGLKVTKKYPDKSWETIDESDPKKTLRTSSSGYVETEYLDGFGRLVKRTDNNGHGGSERTLYECTYNELGEIATETDRFSRKTEHFYSDWQGRETRTVETPYVPDVGSSYVNETIYEYDDENLTETVSFKGVKVSRTQYDDRGNVLKTADCLGGRPGGALHPVREFFYNGKGQEISSKLLMAPDINAPGREVISKTSEYDLDENEISSNVKTSDGGMNAVKAEFNAFGYVNSSDIAYKKLSPGVGGPMMGFGSEVKEYDNAGNIVKVTNGLLQSMHFTYDKSSNMTLMTDFTRKKTEYKYDVMDRLLSVESGDMAATFTYYPAGSPAEGLIRSRELHIGRKLTDKIEYGYNSRGLLEKVTYMNGKTRLAEYDDFDRLKSITDINGTKTLVTYDNLIPENIVRIENRYGRVDYSYFPPEAGGLLGPGTTLRQASFSSGTDGAFAISVEITYDYYNQIANSSAPSPLMLKGITATGSGGVLLGSLSYEYDEMGRTAKLTRKSSEKDEDSTRTFIYNDNNQLISDETSSLAGSPLEKTSYVYDIRGNIISRTVSGSSAHGKTSFEYDADNRLKSSNGPNGSITSYAYDENGALKKILINGKEVKKFEYNSFGQLVRYSGPSGSDVSYSYDAEGLRSIKKDNNTKYSIRYYYDFDKRIMNEEDSNGSRVSTLASLLRVVDGKHQWLITDRKDVIGFTDEKARAPVEEYSYTAYGKEQGRAPQSQRKANEGGSFSISGNPYRFSGYYEDEESGMYYLKARSYSPELMRFTSRDSYDLTNRYAYADGNPVEIVDPDGQIGVVAVLAIVTLASGAIGGGLSIAANKIEEKNPDSGYQTVKNLRTSSRVFGGVSLATGLGAAAGSGYKAYKAYKLRQAALRQEAAITRLNAQRDARRLEFRNQSLRIIPEERPIESGIQRKIRIKYQQNQPLNIIPEERTIPRESNIQRNLRTKYQQPSLQNKSKKETYFKFNKKQKVPQEQPVFRNQNLNKQQVINHKPYNEMNAQEQSDYLDQLDREYKASNPRQKIRYEND